MNLMPEFDADPVEDDFYAFRDNEIERVDSNQAELTLLAGSSVNEVEMTKHDLDSDKETVPLPDGSRDNEIQRVDSNQAELTLPAGSSVDEAEMTKHDLDSDKETVPLPDGSRDNRSRGLTVTRRSLPFRLAAGLFDYDPLFCGFSVDEVEMTKHDPDSDKETVPLPDGSSLEPKPVEQDVIPVAVQEVEDPFVAPPEEIAPPFIFEDGGSTDVEAYVLCDEEEVLLYAQRRSFSSKLPPFWLERVEVMLTQADESGTHADELLADYDMLLEELELEMGFQEDQFSALAVSMIVHAEEMNVLSNELSVETNRHLGNLDIIFLEHERLAIQEDFQLVLEDCDRLDKVALGLRRCAAYLTECVQYYQQLQDGEEKGDEVEFLPQEQEAAEGVLLEVKPNEDEDRWPENPQSVQQVKKQQTLEEGEEVPESWEDRL